MFRIHLTALAPLALCGALAGACGDDPQPASETPTTFELNRALWSEQELHDYQFRFDITGFVLDEHGPVTITVHDDAIVAIESADGRSLLAEETFSDFRNVEALFDYIAERTETSDEVEANYNEELGYPVHANFSYGSEGDGFDANGLVGLDPTCLEDGASCSAAETLAASADRWREQEDPAHSTYCVERSYMGFAGYGYRSFGEYTNGALTYWRITELMTFDDPGTVTEGTDATDDARLASMNAMYAQCRDEILTRSAEDYEIVVEYDEDGLLSECVATALGCADDCSEGIELNGWTAGPCARPE